MKSTPAEVRQAMFDEHGGGIREFTSNRDALDQPCDRHQKSRGQCRPRP